MWGHCKAGIIKLSQIKGICPLAPVLGEACDPEIVSENCFDKISMFYINPYSSHMFFCWFCWWNSCILAGNLNKIPLFFDLPFPGSHDVHHPSSPPYPHGHHEPPPPTDCYCSPPHEGQINPQVEHPASPYDDPHHPSFLPTQHQALIQDLLFVAIRSNGACQPDFTNLCYIP